MENRIIELLKITDPTDEEKKELAGLFESLAGMADICDETDMACEYYTRAKDIRMELNESDSPPEDKSALSAVLTKLGDLAKKKENYSEAMGFYAQALHQRIKIINMAPSMQAYEDYAVSLAKAADINCAFKRYETAAEGYEHSLQVLSDQAGSPAVHTAYAKERLAYVSEKLGDRNKAETLYRQALAMYRRLFEEDDSEENEHALGQVCYDAGMFFHDAQLLKEAYEIWKNLAQEDDNYIRYRDMAQKEVL